MNILEIIEKKRDGHELSREEIDFFVSGYTHDDIKDYQASAMLMAMFINGLNKKETYILTEAMKNSGEILDLKNISGIKIDKHSTGGVGDKTTLIVGPIVASLGLHVVKFSGRGLGFTGGTIDKLESIEGFKTKLEPDEFISQVNEIGIAIMGQSKNITPADKKIYALRDVTSTVDSIPLITSSIMSKKLASGSDAIVLDVKYGSGAFMKDVSSARELANNMIEIGRAADKKMAAIISSMEMPLGRCIGNSLEVKEAIDVLKGNATSEELLEVCVELSSIMVSLGYDITLDEARNRVLENIKNGKAFETFKKLIISQGGNKEIFEDSYEFQKSKNIIEIKSKSSGFISGIDAQAIGLCSSRLGAGRVTKEDTPNLFAGIELNKIYGEKVEIGDVLAVLHTDKNINISEFENIIYDSYTITEELKSRDKMIADILI